MWHRTAHRVWCSDPTIYSSSTCRIRGSILDHIVRNTAHPPEQPVLLQPAVCVKHSPQKKRSGRMTQVKIWHCQWGLETLLKQNDLSLPSLWLFLSFICCAWRIASFPLGPVTKHRWRIPSVLKYAVYREVYQLSSLTWWNYCTWNGNQNQRWRRKKILNMTDEASQANRSDWKHRGLGMSCEDQNNRNKPPPAFCHVLSSQ